MLSPSCLFSFLLLCNCYKRSRIIFFGIISRFILRTQNYKPPSIATSPPTTHYNNSDAFFVSLVVEYSRRRLWSCTAAAVNLPTIKLVYFLVLYCSCISVNAHPPWVCNETELAVSGGPTEDHITYPTIIVGLRTEANVSDPIIKNISAFALPTIDSRLHGTFKIAQIVSAETRTVAGTVYYLRLEVCTTNSNRGEDDASSECIQTEEVNKYLCDVQVWDRPWLPEREVTELNCTAIDARQKRELAVSGGPTEDHIIGGLTKANVSDPIIKNISASALPTIDNRLDGTFKIARILSAETQVVEGTLYYLRLEVCANASRGEDDSSSECIQTGEVNKYLCDVQVWDRPWLPKREVTELNCTAINARRKRELAVNAGHTEGNTTYPTTIPGGLTKANVSDPIIKNISAFALPVIDRRYDATFKIGRIISAETQVVNGVNYYIRLEVCSTNSDSGEDDASSACITTGESNKYLCDVQVWDGPWLPKREVTELNCTAINARRKRELAVNAGHTEGNTTYPTIIPGGRTKANVSDPIIKNISAFALPTIDNRLDGTFKIARIISAETQVVEGVIYYIRLEVCSTNSNSGEDDASSPCIITGESNQQVCDVQVWDRPWLPKREVTQVNCIPINSRRK
ncbi:uncharacterized protein LOC126260640 [Schistocerca nitens]|uniref:uncharacterized protein LOC126260640 n=1 Tax=Schistocerca nitens TaxID=7011 RepID=UPI002117907D|nr:uncharacterized protein LOC126260640 [Schistocerca nitens]